MHCDDNGICYDSIYGKKPPDMNRVREFARKKSIEFAIKRYFEGAKYAKNKRYFYNDGKKLMSEKDYRMSLARQKLELKNTLANLLRKDDRIEIPLSYTE